MLLGGDAPAALAEVILASQLHFFISAHPTWCEQWILPLLDWTAPGRARRAWDGFLRIGRPDDRLLGAGLLGHYEATADHLQELPDELRERYCEHLAWLALYSDIDPIESGWLRKFTATVDDGLRTEWMNHVAWTLEGLPVDVVEYQWTRWMRRYWADRLESVPVQLTINETSAMAAWVVYLGDSIEEGVLLALRRPARLAQHSNLLSQISPDRARQVPGSIATLVAHLLNGTERPFFDCWALSRVAQVLRAQPEPPDLTAIVEEALRLGCADAADW